MRIKKTSQTTALGAQSVNTYSESTENTYSCDYINKANTYSTTEVKTNKIWIDNKPIYRKIYTKEVESLVAGTSDAVTLNLSEIVSSFCKLEVYYDADDAFVPIPFLSNTENSPGLSARYIKSADWVSFFGTMDYVGSGGTIIIIVEYTKASD